MKKETVLKVLENLNLLSKLDKNETDILLKSHAKWNCAYYDPLNAYRYLHLSIDTCSKFSKPGFSNTSTVNFQMFKLVLEKAEEPEIKFPTSTGLSKKQESSRKTSISALLIMPKSLCELPQTMENS